MVFINFDNNDKFAVLTYTPQKLAESLLNQNAKSILQNGLHSFQSLPDNKNFEIQTADTNIIVRSQNKSFVFANSFTTDRIEKSIAQDQGSEESIFNPELMQKLMFPIAIVTVCVYQFYCKAGKKTDNSAAGPGIGRSRASKDKEIE